jgi:hypothetical protein
LLQEEDENELVQIEDNLLENELKRELSQGSKVRLHLHQDEDEPKQKSNRISKHRCNGLSCYFGSILCFFFFCYFNVYVVMILASFCCCIQLELVVNVLMRYLIAIHQDSAFKFLLKCS